MIEKKIRHNMVLSPSELPEKNQNVLEILFKKAQQKLVNSVSTEEFFIKRLVKLEVKDSYIESATGNVRFMTVVKAETQPLNQGQILFLNIKSIQEEFVECKILAEIKYSEI